MPFTDREIAQLPFIVFLLRGNLGAIYLYQISVLDVCFVVVYRDE